MYCKVLKKVVILQPKRKTNFKKDTIMEKKLMKSNDKKLCGVLAGVAEYLELDPTLVRVVYALLSVCSAAFPGLILYIILALVMPEKQA